MRTALEREVQAGRLAGRLLLFSALLALSCWSCTGAHSEPVGAVTSPIICAGVQDVALTDDHVGEHEDVHDEGDAEKVSHTAVLEVVRSNPVSSTVFAAGWIADSDRYPWVSRYQYATGVITRSKLPYVTGARKWIARAGHDPTCTVVPGATSCGWFAWSDQWGDVDWIAVGDNGSVGDPWYTPGWDGSGDIGTITDQSGTHTRQLRAYISTDRTTVLVRLFEGNIQVLGPLTLRTMQTNFKAYQTAVAWSARHERWLVVWAENYMHYDRRWKGKVHSRWVAFDGTQQASAQNLMYCEGDPTTSLCGSPPPAGRSIATSAPPPSATVKADAGPDGGGGTRFNERCTCKGIFLGASYHYVIWPGDTDAFRVHQYQSQARLSGDGYRQALYVFPSDMFPGCGTWCPLDRISPLELASGGYGIYQQLQRSYGNKLYLKAGSPTTELGGQVHAAGPKAQALRTASGLTATLVTNDYWGGAPATLRLSISNEGAGACP